MFMGMDSGGGIALLIAGGDVGGDRCGSGGGGEGVRGGLKSETVGAGVGVGGLQ